MKFIAQLSSFLSQRRKSIAYVLGVGLTYAGLYYGSNHYYTIAVAIAGLLGVHNIPNDPKPLAPLPQMQITAYGGGGGGGSSFNLPHLAPGFKIVRAEPQAPAPQAAEPATVFDAHTDGWPQVGESAPSLPGEGGAGSDSGIAAPAAVAGPGVPASPPRWGRLDSSSGGAA